MDVVGLINNTVFPIAMCVLLCWYIKDQGEKHIKESQLFTEALNKNTKVLQRLCDKMGVDGNEDE